MPKRRWILAAAAALAAGWWLGSPWWTLWRMREAAAAGDSAALASYIDFPAVRESTRAQLGPGLGGLGSALLTPTALRLALASRLNGRAGAGEFKVIRSGASEFRLHRQGRAHGKVDLVFRRHGLGWKLAEVRLAPGPD
ncbi:MAG TPA: DUF2939 domain-containing protein [Allosphingosinicella sp.]|jgi:hypothetical protein